jgi:hypothetical protein
MRELFPDENKRGQIPFCACFPRYLMQEHAKGPIHPAPFASFVFFLCLVVDFEIIFHSHPTA